VIIFDNWVQDHVFSEAQNARSWRNAHVS